MNFDFTKAMEGFSDTENHLKQEYLQISTGRANPALLDGINVESYGSFQPVKNIASITLEDARTMMVAPWDKSQIKDIEKAITGSNLPFSLSTGDAGVRIHIPQMTEESKTKILRLVKEKLEDARVRIRNVRQEVMRTIETGESNGDFSKDAESNYKEELQKKVDASNKKLEEIFDKKQIDIMSV
jgi:ribosome recycling factor